MGWAAKTKQQLSAGPTTREAACTLGEGVDGAGLGVAVGGSAVGEMAAEGRAGSDAETKQQLSAGPTTREAACTLNWRRGGWGWAGLGERQGSGSWGGGSWELRDRGGCYGGLRGRVFGLVAQAAAAVDKVDWSSRELAGGGRSGGGGRVSRDDWAEVLVGGVVMRVVVGHEGVVVVEMPVVVGHEGVWRIMALPLPVQEEDAL